MTTQTPIFILSCSRSGSSLLRYLIDTHPDIASPSELQLAELCQQLYYAIAATLGVTSDAPDIASKDREILLEVRQIVSGILERYTRAKNKRLWCEKTPKNLDKIDVLKAVFPDARFICLYRNAMDVVHSLIECSRVSFSEEQLYYLSRNSGNLVGGMVEYWIDKTQKLLKFERANPHQCWRIRYEAYVLNPEKTLEPMFDFLEVARDPTIAEKVFQVEHDPGWSDGKVQFSGKINTNSIGKGSTLSRETIPDHLLARMNQLLEELDYPIIGENWDYSPSPYRPTDLPKNAAEVFSVEEFFSRYLPKKIPKLIEGLPSDRVVYQFILTGASDRYWTLDLTQPDNPIYQGSTEAADCTLTLSSEDLLAVINSQVNPLDLWNQGKIKSVGDREYAEKLAAFLVGRSDWQKDTDFWWQNRLGAWKK